MTSGTTLPMSNPSHYGGKALDLALVDSKLQQ